MTVGLSPKVRNPTLVLFGIGALLLVLGVLLDSEELTELGAAGVAASGVTLGAGYASPPGEVLVEPGPPSDELLSATHGVGGVEVPERRP